MSRSKPCPTSSCPARPRHTHPHPGNLLAALLLAGLALLVLACAEEGETPAPSPSAASDAATAEAETEAMISQDVHSFARPQDVSVKHLDLDLTVDFKAQMLHGKASLTLDNPQGRTVLYLDSRDLEIQKVALDQHEVDNPFSLGEPVPYLGRELAIAINPDTEVVHVHYTTSPEAAALLWLSPEQTAGGEHPFLFTQSQAILARTWVPCQDTPAVRMTYEATIRVPTGLMAVMSAENSTEKAEDGVYHFRMPQPIPSYLLALAVGDLAFQSVGDVVGVYAEPAVLEKAAWEFAETGAMIEAVEPLYGPYRWGRYDMLVLPPSFPFGGMENPRLTFVTPTILAGDRSLVALIAHELAHSWSGNLVTNATWNDFWLNEGFTVYLERRIMEAISGKPYADMLAVLGAQDLEAEIERLGPQSPDTHLHLALEGRDADDGMTDVAYEKGYAFLRMIEETVGRQRFDAFLRSYFERHTFQSLTTETFVAELREHLVAGDEELEAKLQIDAWVYGPGLPDNAVVVASERFAAVDEQIAAFTAGTPAAELNVEGWTTHEWLHFLRGLPETLTTAQMQDLDTTFGFSETGNSEKLHAWLLHAIHNQYEPAYPALEAFLTGMGRRKFLRPLYRELAKTPEGLERAKRIYAEARPTYHTVSTSSIDEILGWGEEAAGG